MSNKLIPFSWLPASWGLKGKSRAIAQAEYELSGYELDYRLAQIESDGDLQKLELSTLSVDLKHNKITQYEYDKKLAIIQTPDVDSAEQKLALLKIDLNHGKIDQYKYDVETSIIGKESNDLEVAKLDVDLKHSRITQQEYERKKADLLGEPWMAMPKISWDPINPSKTFFELDYNDFFVKFLRDNGYVGTDDDCISRWLNDVCMSIVDEMGQVDQDFITTVKKIRLPDGKTEHS